jgi:hypothetical protein
VLAQAFGIAVAVFSLFALTDWRLGIRLAIIIGLAQDPIRKLIPGTPAIMAVSSAPIWLAIFFGAMGRAGGLRAFRRAHPALWHAAGVFVLALVPPTLLVLLRYGLSAAPVAAIGLFGYLAPIAALVVGTAYGRSPQDVDRLLRFYCVASAVAMIGTFLEYSGRFSHWPAIGTEALGGTLLRYDTATLKLEQGFVVLVSGFFRSPDIMGWHAAALLIGSLSLLSARPGLTRLPWLGVALLAAACVLISGRRKAILMPMVWVAVIVLRGLTPGRLRQLATVGLAVGLGVGILSANLADSRVRDYYGLASTMVVDAPSRFVEATWGSVWGTYLQTGLLGNGIGTASQGRQHLAVQVGPTWQESGPSKLMVEIGLPGTVCALLLASRLGRALLATTRTAAKRAMRPELALSLVAMTAANAASFAVSHQTYSDTLVVALSAAFAGMALASGRSVPAQQQIAGKPSRPGFRRTAAGTTPFVMPKTSRSPRR